MADDREALGRNQPDPVLESGEVASSPKIVAPVDPADEVPVPAAMFPAEIDERAQVVEALRGKGTDDEPV